MGAPLVEKKKMALKWFAMMPEERLGAGLPPDKLKLRRYLGVGKTALGDWEEEYFKNKTSEVSNHLLDPPEEEYDSDAWLRSRTEAADKALLQACAAGNSAALTLFNKLINRLVEKTEVKVGLSADEIARRNLEAERELKQWRLEQGGKGR